MTIGTTRVHSFCCVLAVAKPARIFDFTAGAAAHITFAGLAAGGLALSRRRGGLSRGRAGCARARAGLRRTPLIGKVGSGARAWLQPSSREDIFTRRCIVLFTG